MFVERERAIKDKNNHFFHLFEVQLLLFRLQIEESCCLTIFSNGISFEASANLMKVFSEAKQRQNVASHAKQSKNRQSLPLS